MEQFKNNPTIDQKSDLLVTDSTILRDVIRVLNHNLVEFERHMVRFLPVLAEQHHFLPQTHRRLVGYYVR
jgi:hypothetical protein